MYDSYPKLLMKGLENLTRVMEALPDMQQACRHMMDFIFEILPAARVAILVNPRPTEREGQDFIAEVFGERGVEGPVSFTPRAEAIESAYSQGKPYVSPDRPHIVCAPVIMPDGIRGTVYFESNGVDSEFIAEQAECTETIAAIVGSIIARAEEIRAGQEKTMFLYEQLRKKYKMVGDGPAMRALQAGMRRAAAGDGPVLVLGESGTGKELIAFGIHDMSSRRGLAFIGLKCWNTDHSSLEEALLGELAINRPCGTVFLKEIARLALPLQKKLFEILQREKPEVRLMASTELDLDEQIARRAFLPELAEQLTGYTLLAPSLRERPEDIPLLVNHFFEKHRHGYKVTGISPEAVDILCSSWWPNNVLNLDLGIDEAIMTRGSGIIRPEDLPEMLTQAPLLMSAEKQSMDTETRLTTNAVRRKAILRRLQENGGDPGDAAVALGVLPEVVYAVLSGNN